jgi:hypothetical protein
MPDTPRPNLEDLSLDELRAMVQSLKESEKRRAEELRAANTVTPPADPVKDKGSSDEPKAASYPLEGESIRYPTMREEEAALKREVFRRAFPGSPRYGGFPF